MQIGIAHKGVSFLRIALLGRAAHGSRPDEGVNAAVHASRLVLQLQDQFAIELSGRRHHLLGPSTLNVGRLCGGTQPNIVADRCEIEVDRRTLPGEAAAISEMEQLVADYCSRVDGLSYEIVEMPESALTPHVPLETPADCDLVAAVGAAASRLGLETTVTGLTYWTDGAVLAASGAETVVVGPGDIAQAHGPDEWVPLHELEMAARLYYETALDLLAGAR
jgi:acetylornithine deacetylase/succinyl-diaminopimelate desuccinylase-like protein